MALNDHLLLFEEQSERNIDSGLIEGTHIMLQKKETEMGRTPMSLCVGRKVVMMVRFIFRQNSSPRAGAGRPDETVSLVLSQ